MGIDLPEPLRWLFKLTGSEWPDADEDKIAKFGEQVGGFSDRIDMVNSNMVDTVRLANLSNSGPAMSQYTDNLRDVVDNGMPGMSVGARSMAAEIHDAALQVEYSKGTAVINMAIMAPMIADAIAAAPETFGATMAIAEAGIAAVRTTVPKLLTQMVEKVVTNTVMMEAGDLAVQGYQVLVKRDRAGFDSKLSLNTIEMGAIGGAVDGALTGALMKGAPKFFKTAEAGVTDASKLVWAPPKWANMATQVANNTVTSLIMDGVNHQPIDGLSLLQGAALGAAMGGLHRNPGVKVQQFDGFHMKEDFLNGDSWVRPNGAYADDRTGTNDFSFTIRRQPGNSDGGKTVWYGDPNVEHPENTPPLHERLGPVIDKTLENRPEGAPKPRFTVLEDVPPAQLDGIRNLAAAKGVDIVVPHGAVEPGPYGSVRVPGGDGGSGFRMVHPDGSVEHLGGVYDPRQTVGDPVVGGEPPEVRVALGGGEKFVSKEVAGEGDCTVASLADSALSQGVTKKGIHADGLNLSDAGDMREFRNRIADQVAAKSTDTRPGSDVLLGELSPDGARTVLERIGPAKASSSSHIDALDLATPAPPRSSRLFPDRVPDPVRELNDRLQEDPATVLSALADHYSADGDKGMAQLATYAKAKAEAGGDVPRHRDLLDYAIRERTLAETPLGGEMLQAVAHTLGLDVVVVSGDKPAFHLNGDSAKRVYIHRVTTEDGRNHYRALRPETKGALSKLSRRTPHPLPGDRPKTARPEPHQDPRPSRVPVSSRGGHGAVTRRPTGSVGNALHRLAGGAHGQTGSDRGLLPRPAERPTAPQKPHHDVADLMRRAGRSHNASLRPRDGFETTGGPDVMGVREVRAKPEFLTGLHLDDLPPERLPEFFGAVDLARPGGPATGLDSLFTGHEPPPEHPPIPKLLHSIWLGGPLHDDGGDRAKFMETMGANADKTGFTSVLWTDVPRGEIDELRALGPDVPRTPRQRHVQQMLDWAGRHGVKLANVDEVFAGADKARLHAEIATERARTTGSGYAGASDLLRLDILHRFGGVYTDGDNRATEKLADLVTEVEQDREKGQFGISSLHGSINNSAFIAPPGNRIVSEYRENLKERYAAPLRDVLAEKHARGKPDVIETLKPLQDPARFASRDVRTEVITRTGPTYWTYDKLARAAGAPEDQMGTRRWFKTITEEHLATGSESSWLTDATSRPPADHTPVYLAPEKTVQAAVTVLHREAVNREGVLHLPSVMDIVDKAAPEHREQVWHAVLHTMDETWPRDTYPKPDIVVSGRFQTPAKKGDPVGRNQSVPRPVKDYLHSSGLFQGGTFHTAVGHDFVLPEDRYLSESMTEARLRNVTPERAQDISRVHKLLFGDSHMSEPDLTVQASKVLDLLHATSPGDSRTDPLWAPKALRDLVEFRIGADGNYEAAHLDTLLAHHDAFVRRGQLTPDGYRRHVEYVKRIPEGEDPDKFAGTMSPRPPSRVLGKLSPADHANRWDRAVDLMALRDEVGGLTAGQERGLWKLIGLYRKTPGNAVSDRPLTLRDMAAFRDQVTERHPDLDRTITDPKAWTLKLAERANALSPVSGKLRIDDLVRHARQNPDEPSADTSRELHNPTEDQQHSAQPYPEPPATLQWFHKDAAETVRQFDELGPLVAHLPPAHFRDLIGHAGFATEHMQRYGILRQLHINIAHLQPEGLRTSIQGSRFHRRLSDELRKYVRDPEIDKRDLAAFQNPAEAHRFRGEYVHARPDGSGIWIRDPRSQHDMQTHAPSTTMLADPGHFTVVLHGSPQQVHVGTSHLSARDMANLLRQTPEWRDDPRPIRMIACNTGEHDEGFAQQLADLLGVEVKAPNTVVWGVTGGKPYASTLVRRPDGTLRPVKQADGAYRVFTPRRRNPDGSVHSTPIRLDTGYDYLGRKPALTVLSRALAGSFGDALAGSDPVTRKIVNDWRHLMGQTGGDSEKAFEVSETARDALDKVLTPDTVQWMFRHAPAGTEVNQALHVLSGSRLRAEHGGRDQQPPGVAYPRADASPAAYADDSFSAHAGNAGLSLDPATTRQLSAVHHALFPDTAASDVTSMRQAHDVLQLARIDRRATGSSGSSGSAVRPAHVEDLIRRRFGPGAAADPATVKKLSDEYTALKSLGPVDEHAWRTHLEYQRIGDAHVGDLIQPSHLSGDATVSSARRELVDRVLTRTYDFTLNGAPTERETRTLIDVLNVARDMGFRPDFFPPGADLAELRSLWKTVETHRELLPAHSAALERPIRYSDLENLGRQLGLSREAEETQRAFVQRLDTNISSFRSAHPNERLSGSAMARHLAMRDEAAPAVPHAGRPAPVPRPRTEITDEQARRLSDDLGGQIAPENLKKLAALTIKKFPAFADPRREPQLSDFTDIVHQLLGPTRDVRDGTAVLAQATTRARKSGSLSALADALPHREGDFVRAPWTRARFDASVPWSERHAIERDAALLYHHAFGQHAPAHPDARTARDMRRAMQVAKLAHNSYDRREQTDPAAFYQRLGERLRPLAGEDGTGAAPFRRLLHAAGSGDGRYQNPDFLAGPMRTRLHAADEPRPPLGHSVASEGLTTSRALAKQLPGLFTATGFGDHEQIETRLRALIPGRGALHFEVGLPTELREGFGAMVDGGLTLRVTRDGHVYDVHLKALLKRGLEPVEESEATAKNESRMFRTGESGGAGHSTSRTLTVDGGVKVGYGPLSVTANSGASRIRSRELTSSEAYGGDIYLDPSDGTKRHTVQAQVHIEVTDTATGHWVQDVPAAGGPVHTVELRVQDHLTADGDEAEPKTVVKRLDDPAIDHLLCERTGYGEELKHRFLARLHETGTSLDEKARAEVDAYFSELASPHNLAALHSADPRRRAELSTAVTGKDRDGRAITISLGAHAEARTLIQASESRAGLKMDAVARHTVRQGVTTGRGGGLPSSLAASGKLHEGPVSLGGGVGGNSTRTESASLESAYTVTRTVRAEDENASYRMTSDLDLHLKIGDGGAERVSVPDATAWVRLRPGDHQRLTRREEAPQRTAAADDADRLNAHLMTSHELPLGQVKKISNLNGFYDDLVTSLAPHLPEDAAGDLAEKFRDDPTGSFLHGADDEHENWRRIVAAVSGPGLAQRADALTGEGVTVKLRIDGKDVPLRISLDGLKPAEAVSLGTDDKLMQISVHQASQTTRIRSSRQQDLSLTASLGAGKSNGLFSAAISARHTKAARSTVSGGVRQYTRSIKGSTLFDVGGRLRWKLDLPDSAEGSARTEPIELRTEGSVDSGLHLWVSSELVKATFDLEAPRPPEALAPHEHSPLTSTPIHMAVNGGGMDVLRAAIKNENPDLAAEFGNGRFAAELPLLTGGGLRVAPGVHWDVTPTGRPQVLKKLSVYVESHGEAGTAVDHDGEHRRGKGGSGFGGGTGAGLTGGATLSHSRDTAQGSNTGHGESSTRLMTAKTVEMALVRTEVRHRVTGVNGRTVETVGETLVMVPLSEVHRRQEDFQYVTQDRETFFEGFEGPGEADPSPALASGMLFGPVGAHPDGGLGLEATAKAEAAFGDRDLNEQVRDLLQTPTLASQIRSLTDGGLTHPIVTESGGRYELRIQAKPLGHPVLHATNATGGVKMYNADTVTSAERSGGSKTASGAATFGIATEHLTVSATHAASGTSGDVESRARRDVESEGLRYSGESVDEYRQDVEYTYTISRLSHPLWNLHFGDRPPETLQKSVGGSYVSEVRVFEPKTHALEAPTVPSREPEPDRALSPTAAALDWHGQEKISTLFQEAGGWTDKRHAPADTTVLSKGSFTASLHDILKEGGTEFRGVDLGGRTLMMKRGVRVEGTLKAPKSVAFLKAGAERESFSHREVATTTEHSEGTKQDTKGQVAASGVTPGGVTVGARVGVGHATEQREKSSETQSSESRPRWDRRPGGLYAVHVPMEVRLDFGRGERRTTTVDVLVHVDAAGAEALGVPAAKLRELRGEPPAETVVVPEPVVHEPVVAPVPEPEPAVEHEPVVAPAPAPVMEPEPVGAREPVLEAIPLDAATREELGRFTPDELTQLEHLARTASAEDFQRLTLRASLAPGTIPEAALLERVPGLLSRDHVLQAVQETRDLRQAPPPPPVVDPLHHHAPTPASVAPLVARFQHPGDDSVTVHTVPAGTTVYRLVDIRTALAHLGGRIEPLNRLGWIHLGRGLYTAPDHERAISYDDGRFDRVMLRLTLRRDMVGMNIRESGTNASAIGHQLGERDAGVVNVTDAGRDLLAGSDFVAVHHGEEGPYEIKFHEGAFDHFAVQPDAEHVTGYGDGVLAVYGDWAQRGTDLPAGTDHVLAEIGRLATGAETPWHQVTGDHVRQLADAVGLPHDRLAELHELILIHDPATADELRAALTDAEDEDDAHAFATIEQHQADVKIIATALTDMGKKKFDVLRKQDGYQDVVDKAKAVAAQTDDRGHLAAVNDLHAAAKRFTDSLPPELRRKFEHSDLGNATGQAFARVSIVELRLRRDTGAFQVHVGHDFADDTARTEWVGRIQREFTDRTDDVLWIRNADHKQDTVLKPAIDAMMASPDTRYFTVALHGSPGSVHVGDGHLSVKEMAALIRADSSWSQNKRPVRLFSCYTGMDDHGFAHELAKELGVDVIAPNDKAWADRNGNTYVSENLYKYGADGAPRPTRPKRKEPDTGTWRRFSPDGGVELELAPGGKLGRTAALTLLTRTLPRTEDEITTWPEPAHEPLRALAGVLVTSDTLFERHLIDKHMDTMRDALSGLLDDKAVETLTTHVPADRGDLREVLHHLAPDRSPEAHDGSDAHDPVPVDPVAFAPEPQTPEEILATVTSRLQNSERVWVTKPGAASDRALPLTLVDGAAHLGSLRLTAKHMAKLEVAKGFSDPLSLDDPEKLPDQSVKPNGNQRMLFHNRSLMFGHFTGDIVRVGTADRFANQHLTVDKALPALFTKLATQDPAEVQTFLALIHHERTLAGDTMTGGGYVAPANIHFRPAPARQHAVPLPSWLGDQSSHANPPPEPQPTEVNTDVTYARFRAFVQSRLTDLDVGESDRTELMGSLDWTASRFHPAPDTMTAADRTALFSTLYLNAGERLDFSKMAVVLQRLSGHEVPPALNLIVRGTSPESTALTSSLRQLRDALPAGSPAAATIQALLDHTGELQPAAPPLNAAISVIMEHYWPTVLGWMPPPE